LRARTRHFAEDDVEVDEHHQHHGRGQQADGERREARERVRDGQLAAQRVLPPKLRVLAVVHARRRVRVALVRGAQLVVRQRGRQHEHEREEQRADDAEHVQRLFDFLEGGRAEVKEREKLAREEEGRGSGGVQARAGCQCNKAEGGRVSA
jgi:hypothetical protein